MENQIKGAVAGIRLGEIHRLNLILRAHFQVFLETQAFPADQKLYCLPSKINCLKILFHLVLLNGK